MLKKQVSDITARHNRQMAECRHIILDTR